MSDGFLARWSRRKEAVRHAEHRSGSPLDESAQITPGARQRHTHDAEAHAAEADITPDEIAALPKIDDLTADSDISGFLRRGVPNGLRNAALRKIWMLDPTIRDFVGPARDYAYDWNTPGGVPGSGKLPSDTEVAALVRQVVGDSKSNAPTRETPAQGTSPDRCVVPDPSADKESSAATRESSAQGKDEPTASDIGTEASNPPGAER